MLDHVRRFITGWKYAEFPLSERVRMFDMMYRHGIRFEEEKHTAEGMIRVRLCGVSCKAFAHYAAEAGAEHTLSAPYGLPAVIEFIKLRPAVPAGFIILAAWIMFSTRIIWDVKVEGAENIDTGEIISLLDELGCGVGDYYPGINFNDLNAKYLAMQNDIAWITVYMNGTVAEVQVREARHDERGLHDKGVYANVIAETDGIVERVNVFEGQVCVKPGELIRKGDIAISGIIEQKDGSFRYEYAAGEVICRIATPIEVKIDVKREGKRYTGRRQTKKTIKIFKKTINLFVNSGTLYEKYDKIYTMEKLCPLGLCELPIWIEKTTYREYETEETVIPIADAANEALAELDSKLKAATDGAELISKQTAVSFEDGIYRISCLLYLSRDIGSTAEFKAEQ